ncbi:hypothetical protein [Mesorhizobium sp. M6A.T.Ce.TU.016.01.1.1]|uniref:hypothetical protein n=1 Tax=Mesorhizobium sp. M6A.T.Ce.TU.016.01.1.1 TaxID=2496783 RepID=UPI000FCAE864|nr:hypothetical protein [Mesorhizobium sp. M6A.T.Ce.TU.016.01.1.1]RUU26824.1 hypothetical protein EOC94_25130 [Mesorhizobium sp. M6A.T.Ce.TU.016.01.1.1]
MTVLVAREIEAISDVDIVGWANSHTAPPSYAEDAAYVQLARCNPRNAVRLAKAHGRLRSLVARSFPDFNDKSDEAKEIARKLFLRRIRTYLDGEIEPFQICRMVSPIENKYDFPLWLGDLYNGCDWMDENATREQASHLRWMIEQILAENAELQSFGSE